MQQFPVVCGIYAIAVSGKPVVYIGQAVNIKDRMRHHYNDLKRSKHKNPALLASWCKYGDSRHEVAILEILQQTDKDTLTNCEQKWMDDFRSSGWKILNAAPVAGSQLGFRHSESTRLKISQIQIGKKISEATRRKMSIARMGNKNSLGYKHTEETLAKRKAVRTGMHYSPEAHARYVSRRRARMKTYLVISPDGKEQPIVGLKAFCKEHGLSLEYFGQILRGKGKQQKGGWTIKPWNPE